MKKLVILKFGGNIDSELHVTLEIANDGERAYRTITGKLPGNTTITPLLDKWHNTYRSRYGQFRIKQINSRSVNIESLNEDCQQQSQQLLQSFNTWLQSKSFSPIVSCLEQLKPESEIRVIICTECQELRKLPWHLWDVLTNYQGAEIALSSPHAERGNRPYREKIRILIILGDSSRINVDADRQQLETYCGEAEIILLKEPSREKLNQHLQDNIGWDILFFSGHSLSQGTQGRIFLNSHDSLTMAELRDALQIAIERRLQVAFFNSCDGLGIAYELEQLNIPQVIVMRLSVPDKVAQEFLKYFLQQFTGGKSLYISVRNAREQLRSLEQTHPCASWLPVIVQNQTETPPTWQSLGIISFCPYQGLAAFGEANAEYFFGREKATFQLVSAVNNKPLVAVVGASGSGKSSLVFAGLIPQLRRDTVNNWLILSFRPLKNPFESLAKALVSAFNLEDDDRHLLEAKLELELRKDTSILQTTISRIQTLSPDSQRRLLLVADQFEEIYTLCSDASDRKIFLDGLLQAVKNAPFFTLVLTLRADFFSKALDDYEPFGKALQNYQPELLVRMSREELERAIVLPATQLGFQLEEGLSNTIINDIQDGDGRLPMLEFTLTQLWKQQHSGRLTHDAYQQIGGVEKALANYASAVYAKLSEEQREKAQQVFIQLVQPGEGTEDTRKLATREDVQDDNWDLVTHLADERLVVTNRNELTNEETVEVVHEALIRHWGRLRGWMQENRKFRVWQEGLKVALQQWMESNKDDGALLRGAPLAVAEDWLQQRGGEVRQTQRWFIEKSVALREREREDKERELLEALLRETDAQLRAASLSTEALFKSGFELEALVEIVKAGKKLQQSSGIKAETRMQVLFALHQFVYGAREFNRLQSHSIVTSITFAPDGNTIASADQDTIKLWNLDGRQLQTIKTQGIQITSLCFSPDGHIIVSGCEDGTIKFWNLDGRQLQIFQSHIVPVRSITFSPDGSTIASIGNNGTIKLWNLDGRLINTLNGHSAYLTGIDFSPYVKIIVSGDWDETIKLWNYDGELIKTLNGHNSRVTKVIFSPDGSTIASADREGKIRFWNKCGKRRTILNGHNACVNSLNFSPDGKTIASGDRDGKIKLWSIDGKELKALEGHKAEITDISFSSDGNTIASADFLGTVKIWSFEGKQLFTIKGYAFPFRKVSFNSKSNSIAYADPDETIKLWSFVSREPRTRKGYSKSVNSLSFSQDSNTIVSASDDGIIRLWDINGREIQTFKCRNNEAIESISFSKDGNSIASGSNDGIIIVWSLDGRVLQSFKGHAKSVKSLSFSKDDKIIASSDCETIKMWSIEGKKLRTLKVDAMFVRSVSFSSDVNTIAYGQFNGVIKICSFNNKQVRDIKGYCVHINSICFSADGNILAAGGDDGVITLWSINGRKIQTLAGHNSPVNSISFSHDSNTIASGSVDGTIKLWSKNGEELGIFTGHSSSIMSIIFSPDGKTLASASDDGTVILWNFDLDNLLMRGCALIRGYLQNNPDVSAEDQRLCDDIKR